MFTAGTERIDFTMMPKEEQKYVYSFPFILGKIYNVWWGTGIDFSHLSIFTTPTLDAADPGVVFKFNYTENR